MYCNNFTFPLANISYTFSKINIPMHEIKDILFENFTNEILLSKKQNKFYYKTLKSHKNCICIR